MKSEIVLNDKDGNPMANLTRLGRYTANIKHDAERTGMSLLEVATIRIAYELKFLGDQLGSVVRVASLIEKEIERENADDRVSRSKIQDLVADRAETVEKLEE